MTLPPIVSRPVRTGTSVLILLLFLSACLNYIDRGSLSVAAPVLAADLKLSPVELGTLHSSFFWSYAGCMLLAGWLVDRYPVTWVFGVGFALWSVATLAAGFVGSMGSLLILRLILGAGESVAFPSYSKIITGAFPPEKRGLPNSVLDAGTKIGPALGTIAGALLLGNYGWRILFIALGAASLLWLLPWIFLAPRPTFIPRTQGNRGPSVLHIMARREAWGAFLGSFSYSYGFYFLLTWLPAYLVNERKLSIASMGVLGSIPFAASAISAVLFGWISDRWISRGGSPTQVRKTFVIAGLLGSVAMLPSALVSGVGACLVFLTIAYAAFGMYSSNHWAIAQTLAGPEAAGKWTGLQNTINSLAGVVAPLVTGYTVQTTGSYFWAFVTPAVMAVIGAASYAFLIPAVEPLRWNPVTPSPQPASPPQSVGR